MPELLCSPQAWLPRSVSLTAALPRGLSTGQFDPKRHRAVWPSTGNYCRGGAYVSSLLGCESIAILPEEMSQERFEWLKSVAGEVIATPGCESNVKEIFDTCWDLKRDRDDAMIFSQFEEFGNALWHYQVTDCILTVFTDSMELYESRIRVQKTGSASIASGESAGLFRKSRSTYIVVPWFSWLSRKTVPPIKLTRRLTKGSPKPAPSKRLA